jgi:hypothetical protein
MGIIKILMSDEEVHKRYSIPDETIMDIQISITDYLELISKNDSEPTMNSIKMPIMAEYIDV